MPVDGTGHNSCCARSILTSDGVFSSYEPMLIVTGKGMAQIGRILVEISRFLLLKIFRIISLHVTYPFFLLFCPTLDLFWQAFHWKATTWLGQCHICPEGRSERREHRNQVDKLTTGYPRLSAFDVTTPPSANMMQM